MPSLTKWGMGSIADMKKFSSIGSSSLFSLVFLLLLIVGAAVAFFVLKQGTTLSSHASTGGTVSLTGYLDTLQPAQDGFKYQLFMTSDCQLHYLQPKPGLNINQFPASLLKIDGISNKNKKGTAYIFVTAISVGDPRLKASIQNTASAGTADVTLYWAPVCGTNLKYKVALAPQVYIIGTTPTPRPSFTGCDAITSDMFSCVLHFSGLTHGATYALQLTSSPASWTGGSGKAELRGAKFTFTGETGVATPPPTPAPRACQTDADCDPCRPPRMCAQVANRYSCVQGKCVTEPL